MAVCQRRSLITPHVSLGFVTTLTMDHLPRGIPSRKSVLGMSVEFSMVTRSCVLAAILAKWTCQLSIAGSARPKRAPCLLHGVHIGPLTFQLSGRRCRGSSCPRGR